jgi:lysyl-tRNA synthetase class 2
MAGRIVAKRLMGKASFTVLQDPGGTIQVYVKSDELARGNYDAFKAWDIGDIAPSRACSSARAPASSRCAQGRRLLVKALRPLRRSITGSRTSRPATGSAMWISSSTSARARFSICARGC